MTDRHQRRVVFVLPSLVGGGAERVVRSVADGIARRGVFDVQVLALLDPPEAGHRTRDGVEVVALGARRVRAAVWPLVRALWRRPPDVVVSTLKHVSTALGLLSASLPRRTVHVARVANTYSQELAAGSAALPHRLLIRLSHRTVDRFVCVSQGVRADLVESFGVPPERCAVVPNPVDVERLDELAGEPGPTLAPTVSAAPVRYLAVGRLEPQKDHATLLRAFASVTRRVDAALLLAGDGSLRSSLEQLAGELGVRDRVQFFGFADNPYPLFRASDALVLSSRFEGLPNVLLEALALGLPCVSTDCPHGPADVLVDPRLGVLVPVGDAGRMADAMVEVVARPAEAEVRREHVRRRYAPETISAAYEAVLAEALGR